MTHYNPFVLLFIAFALRNVSAYIQNISPVSTMNNKKHFDEIALNSAYIWVSTSNSHTAYYVDIGGHNSSSSTWKDTKLAVDELATVGDRYTSHTYAIPNSTLLHGYLKYYSHHSNKWKDVEGLPEKLDKISCSDHMLWGVTKKEGKLIYSPIPSDGIQLKFRYGIDIKNIKQAVVSNKKLYLLNDNGTGIDYVNDPFNEDNLVATKRHSLKIPMKKIKKIYASPISTNLVVVDGYDAMWAYCTESGRWSNNSKFKDEPFKVKEVAVMDDRMVYVIDADKRLMKVSIAPDSQNTPMHSGKCGDCD